ncbi:DUF4159 domain-containing protein [Paracoccus alkenifer]|uniref:DUF4159 domain-containing protein n=1 Tax=Paracoccus alkenifer TaxID=65735 RepID=A0A1H6LFQ5_9RHOB|nr:protein of unknown function [Paracoccus alkenifer]
MSQRILPLTLALLLAALPLTAQEPPAPDPRLAAAAADGALAYVITGDPQTDETSEQGLSGLTAALRARTTVEPGTPVGVDLDQDELSLLTFLYWPVTADQPPPSPLAYARLNRFLRSGGMILFDTGDGDLAGIDGPEGAALRHLAAPLDIPPLAPVPRDHVLTRAYYLLSAFPGRHRDGQVWVEAPSASAEQGALGVTNDGVSPVVIGGNSWAEAWAEDEFGRPLHAIGRGYDSGRQREMALRFGINIVMYALGGNYKSDQVHVPELLERLGREQGGDGFAPSQRLLP